MEFNFSEDQLLLQQTIREFLEGECTAAFVRSLWESETGRSDDFWARLAEIGIPGLLVAEAIRRPRNGRSRPGSFARRDRPRGGGRAR